MAHYYDNSPNKFEERFDESLSQITENFSEKKYRSDHQNYGSSNKNHQKTDQTDVYNSERGKGIPIQLIKFNPKSKIFEFNNEAEELLAEFKNNISFVVLAGRYRTGKSFLLNKLLDLSGEGFRVDPSTTACTEGVWMWSEPIYIPEKKLHVFFLDTEGTSSTNREKNHDAKIFALAILLSSVFIFNSVGCIDEQSISQLSLTTTLSKNIVVSSEKNSSDEASLSKFTPKFIWLLRDFTLELQDSYSRSINPTQYLENALNDKSAISKSTDQNKQIRKALLNFFLYRDCFTLVRPVVEETDLQKLNTLPEYKLRKEFITQVNKLKEKILFLAEAKQLQGVNLNSRMFCAMTKNFIEAINEGGVPNISSAWEFIVENECSDLYQDAANNYNQELKKYLQIDEPKNIMDLFESLQKFNYNANDFFYEKAANKEKNNLFKEFIIKLRDGIIKKELQVLEANEEISESHNKQLLINLSEEIVSNIQRNKYNIDQIGNFYKDFYEFLEIYEKNSFGLKKTEHLLNFLKGFLKDTLESFSINEKKHNESNNYASENNKIVFKEKEQDYQHRITSLEQKIDLYKDRLVKAEREENHDNSSPEKKRYESLKIEVENLDDGIKQKRKDLQKKNEYLKKLKEGVEELRKQEKKKKSSIFCCGASSSKPPPKKGNPSKPNQNPRGP